MTKQLSCKDIHAIKETLAMYDAANYARGEMIANARRAKKYSQETLCELIDVSERKLRDIEKGYGCQINVLLKITKILEINISELMKIGI